MAYPPVQIRNNTAYLASGTISFAAPNLCSPSSYRVQSRELYRDGGRGLCLLKTITATVNTPNGAIEATPYQSSGTAYYMFAIIETEDNKFQVTRVVQQFEDERPEGVSDPTTQQR